MCSFRFQATTTLVGHLDTAFQFKTLYTLWKLKAFGDSFSFFCVGCSFFYTIPFIWMKTGSLICPIYFSDIFYLHIIPWSILGYLGSAVQIWKELLQICTTFKCIVTSFVLIYLLQIAANGLQKPNKYQHRGHIKHKISLNIEIIIQNCILPYIKFCAREIWIIWPESPESYLAWQRWVSQTSNTRTGSQKKRRYSWYIHISDYQDNLPICWQLLYSREA